MIFNYFLDVAIHKYKHSVLSAYTIAAFSLYLLKVLRLEAMLQYYFKRSITGCDHGFVQLACEAEDLVPLSGQIIVRFELLL